MQGLKTRSHDHSPIQRDVAEPHSMLNEIHDENAELIGEFAVWFEQIPRTAEQSLEEAVRSKYTGEAARLYRRLRDFHQAEDNGESLIAKTVDWVERIARKDRDCDCIEDAIEGVFDQKVLGLYIDMKQAIGESVDGPKVTSLSLPSAGLKFRDGALQKMGSQKGTVVASFPLNSINGLWTRKSWNLLSPIFSMGFCSILATISKTSIPYQWLSWVVASSFAATGLFFLSDIRNRTIVVDTEHGIAEYPTTDAIADIEGFVMSIRQQKAAAENRGE